LMRCGIPLSFDISTEVIIEKREKQYIDEKRGWAEAD
jgi:hypothetical protein